MAWLINFVGNAETILHMERGKEDEKPEVETYLALNLVNPGKGHKCISDADGGNQDDGATPVGHIPNIAASQEG